MKIVRSLLKFRLFYIFSGLIFLVVVTVAFPLISGLMQKKSIDNQPMAPAAVNIATTLTDNVSGAQNPGGTITYTARIQNTGTTDATGVVYNNQINNVTTLVAGSVNTSPIAADEAYNAVGNVAMVIPDGAGDLLSNDTDADGNTVTITAGTFATTQGGSITINADGSFNYASQRGFSGTDTYTYTINDGSGASNATATGRITFTVATPIWFINPAAAAGGGGTLASPYKSLTAFSTANAAGGATDPADGDNIFLYSGTHTGGITTLRANQKVIGQGATASIPAITGITAPSGTNQLPATVGARPVIANGAGNGITLNQNNLIRGLNAGGSGFAIDDNGSVGNLTVTEVAINSAGGGFRADGGGTPAVTLDSLTAGGGANGINIASTAGGFFAVTGAVTITNTTGDSISTLNAGSTLNVGGLTRINTTADGFIGIHLLNGAGATTFANIEINGRRDKGIRIAGGNRNITTGAVDIDNANSDTAAALEITAPTGGTISFGDTDINNNNTTATGIEIANNCAACPVSFAAGSSITAANGTDFNVNQGAGNITFNGLITNTAGSMISVQSRTGGTIDFTGNLSHTGANTAIFAGSNTGGTVIFSGATKTLNSSTATAVNLTNNTGATFNFTNGGLDIDTTSGIGFNATGGGAVSVTTGANPNTIDSTTGTALNVTNTSIGASNLTFRSISANGGSSNGIILSNTGSNGLIVTGVSSTAGSGGTIANKTGAGANFATQGVGAYFDNSANISLTNMTFSGSFDNFGIRGQNVTNFTLRDSTFSGVFGNSASEDETAIRFGTENFTTGIKGTALFEGNTIGGGFENNLSVFVYGSDTLNMTVQDSANDQAVFNVNSTALGDDALHVESGGTGSNLTLTVNGVRFNGARGDQLQVGQVGVTTQRFTITNNEFLNTHTNIVSGGGGVTIIGGDLAATSNANVTYTFSGNTIKGAKGDALRAIYTGYAATISGLILNNTIGTNNGVFETNTNGGSVNGGTGINVGHAKGEANGTNNGGAINHAVRIEGNTVRDIQNAFGGIMLMSNNTGTVSTARLEATVRNNTVAEVGPDVLSGFYSIVGGQSGTADNAISGIMLTGNSFTAGAGTGGSAIYLDQISSNARYNIPGYTVNANSSRGENRPPAGGTASSSLNAFWVPLNGTLTNGPFPTVPPNKVDANFTAGITNSAFSLSVPIPPLAEESTNAASLNSNNYLDFQNISYQSPSEMAAGIQPLFKDLANTETVLSAETKDRTATAENIGFSQPDGAIMSEIPTAKSLGALGTFASNIASFVWHGAAEIGNLISPTAHAQEKEPTKAGTQNVAPEAGETVSKTIGTLPAGKSVTIVYQVTIADPACTTSFNTQGTVSGTNFSNVSTNDPDTVAANDVTATTVNKSTATNSLAVSSPSSTAGDSVTLTATVAAVGAGGGCAPSGNVQFKIGGANFGSPVAISGGTAVLMTSALPLGLSSITAEYVGDASFNAITSVAQSHTVNKAATVTVDDSFAGSADAQDLGGGRIFNRNAFATIAGGLTNVAVPGTVNVLAGTYSENVTLNQNAAVNLSGNVTLSGGLTISQGTFTSTTGTFAVSGNVSQTAGTFNANGGSITFNGSAAQTLSTTVAPAFNNLTVNNANGVTFSTNAALGGDLNLTNGILAIGANTLTISPGGTSSRAGGCAATTCFVTSTTGGGLKKELNAVTPSFVFHVGTTGGADNGYTPVALATATPAGAGELTVRAVDAVSPAAILMPQISRHWSLTGSNLTTDLSFTYLDGDLTGTDETKLRIYKEAANQCPATDCVNDATNTGTVTGVSSFSNWTLAEALAPSAASTGIRGRILTADGRAVSKALVTITDAQGATRYALSNQFGYYRFNDIAVGQTVIINAQHKRHQFNPQVLQVQEELGDFNLTANP